MNIIDNLNDNNMIFYIKNHIIIPFFDQKNINSCLSNSLSFIISYLLYNNHNIELNKTVINPFLLHKLAELLNGTNMNNLIFIINNFDKLKFVIKPDDPILISKLYFDINMTNDYNIKLEYNKNLLVINKDFDIIRYYLLNNKPLLITININNQNHTMVIIGFNNKNKTIILNNNLEISINEKIIIIYVIIYL
jgi:hypothetical protein